MTKSESHHPEMRIQDSRDTSKKLARFARQPKLSNSWTVFGAARRQSHISLHCGLFLQIL